jgi:hypothetical protein
VARNTSGVDDSETRIGPSAGVISSNDSTWSENPPSRWWFLPWMSAARAPPTVTNRVPGDTATNHPSGTRNRINRSKSRPASTVTVPAVPSNHRIRASEVMSRTSPPAF